MADIACVFNWPPSQMDEMPLEELGRWHEKAIDRFKAMNGVKE
jgi:Phage P2 GpE